MEWRCWCKCEKHVCQKEYNWNPATCSWEYGKYLATIIDDSVITCDEIIHAETKTFPANCNEKNNL